jgi:CRP/FNR family transcriptional regulator
LGCSIGFQRQPARLDSLVVTRRKLELNEVLFSSGEPFLMLYGIQTGFFKTSVTTKDGREQVIGFHMPGEILGFDGIADDRYTCDAVALEAAQVCVLPYTRICTLAVQTPALQKQLHKIMSSEIALKGSVMLQLGSMKAEERIVFFLLDLSQRMFTRGFSRSDIVLRMSRGEIGSYLGLKLETVSRILSHLAGQGVLEVKQRHVRICDPVALRSRLNTEVQLQHTPSIRDVQYYAAASRY